MLRGRDVGCPGGRRVMITSAKHILMPEAVIITSCFHASGSRISACRKFQTADSRNLANLVLR